MRAAAMVAALALGCTAPAERGSPTVPFGRAVTVEHITVNSARIGAPLAGGPAPFYADITSSAEPDSLVALSAVAAGTTSLHVTRESDGMMAMEPVPYLEVPSEAALSLTRGGAHGMLEELRGEWSEGDTIDVVLRFSSGVSVAIAAPVVSILQAASVPTAHTIHPEARTAINRLRSPFCPGLMLEVCPSSLAEALRDSIQAMASRGLRADSIVELVVAEYGEEWRALPPSTGFGLWAWLIPPALGLVAAALLIIRAATRKPRLTHQGREPTPEEIDRIKAELDEVERLEAPDW